MKGLTSPLVRKYDHRARWSHMIELRPFNRILVAIFVFFFRNSPTDTTSFRLDWSKAELQPARVLFRPHLGRAEDMLLLQRSLERYSATRSALQST